MNLSSVKKVNFTLLEVLIALGLMLIILSTLMAAYLNIEKTTAWWQKEETALFEERFFIHRLLEVFSHLEEIDQTKTFFFTLQNSLIFSYDNGVSLDANLSGSVLGRLFLDPEGNLNLLTWPSRELWKEIKLPPFHREVLMKNVQELQFSFFISTEEEKGWKNSFPKDLKDLPGAIKITIKTKEDQEKIFYFPVPQTLPIILTP